MTSVTDRIIPGGDFLELRRRRKIDDSGDRGDREVTKRAKAISCSPHIYAGKFHCQSGSYSVTKIGAGKFHSVYSFQEGNLKLPNGTSINLAEVVLRTVNQTIDPKRKPKVSETDHAAYRYMLEANIPIPKVYFSDEELIDPENPSNGGFWLIEKMEKGISLDRWKASSKPFEQLSEEDQKVLQFAKSWLTKMAKDKKDHINDFIPRNVMWDKKGELKIVDFGEPKKGWESKLKSYIKNWASGNEAIEAFLKEEIKFDRDQIE